MTILFRIAFLLVAFLTLWPFAAFSQSMDEAKKWINFIYLPNGEGELVPNGTGFFIGLSDTTRKVRFAYVVTAKHVLWDTATKTFVPNAYLRLNRKDGEAGFVRMPIRVTGPSRTAYCHPDTTVDLVVIIGMPDQEKYSFDLLPAEAIRTSTDLKRLGLTEGTDVFFPALFLPHIGEHENYPIVRSGRLALVFGGERIAWGNQMQRLHLVEAISIGGHSGAPVFAWFQPLGEEGTPIVHGQKRMRLVGVMQGYFGQERPIGIRKTAVMPVYETHTGISAVVPADFLQEILYSPELTELRAQQP